MKRKLLCVAMAGGVALHGQQAQKAMGSIATADAQLSGGLEVNAQRARLLSNASVTAFDRTAKIDLERGGAVQVCASSAFHLLRSGTGDALLFALDRGAMEIRSVSRLQDAILTPDLRFTMLTPGPLDLRMRVTREGDTCVENRGDMAPVLQIAEAFGSATYHLAPNQHVLFEHGSLREVVDRESSNCGCPVVAPVMVASGAANGTAVESPQQAAALNPFPAVQSADLTPVATPLPATPAASAAMTYGTAPEAASPAPAVEMAPAVAAPAPSKAPVSSAAEVATEPPASPPGARDLAHRIGRFFKRLFGGR